MRLRVAALTVFGAGLIAPSMLRADEPFRLAVVGLVHGHAGGFINAARKRDDIRLVGVSEPDPEVRRRYQESHHLDAAQMFGDAEQMLAATKPDAVALFTNTFDHAAMVELVARRGLPVMMEKPLAVSVEHARRIERAVAATRVPLVVNYETTWYPSNHEAYRLRSAIGDVRKIVVHDGHAGPRAIGVQPEFLDWLLDPVRNGGGALFDFGCYGADLATWLMDGARPESVTAVTQRLQPDLYPRVDDEATVVVTYPRAVAILQASWNWPFGRKDMEVYGSTGQVITVAQKEVRRRLPGGNEEQVEAPALPPPFTDPLSYLKAVARREVSPSGLSSLATNLVATEILDAARRSAETGATVRLAR